MRTGKLATLVGLAAQALLLSGCATSAVWEQGQFARYHEPANPPNLQVSYSSSRDDYLIQYAEVREDNGAVTARAYWLDREAGRKKPRFVPLSQAQGLEPLLLFRSPPGEPEKPAGRYAVVAATGVSFTLYRAAENLGTFDLPTYADASGRVKQVLLTPPAVVADATIVGGVIVIWTMPIWGQLLADASNR